MATRKASQKPPVSPERLEAIRASIEDWEAGKWAVQVAYGPACTCGLGKVVKCERHPKSTADVAE